MKAALLAEPLPPHSWVTWIRAVLGDVLRGDLTALGGGSECCCWDWKEKWMNTAIVILSTFCHLSQNTGNTGKL